MTTHDSDAIEPVEAALEPWEPHEVVLVPVYSGEPGARDVIAGWEAIIRLYRGWMATGHGTTIEAAIRDALADLGAREAGR